MTHLLRPAAIALIGALTLAGCAARGPAAAVPPPAVLRYPAYPMPAIPGTLDASAAVRTRHENAWNRLQSGDVRGATRDWSQLLNQAPDFYPAQVGLGFVHLATGDYDDAAARFAVALGADETYLPAWVGRAEALLGLEREAEAVEAMERVLALDPSRESVRTRLELVRFRLTQSSIEAGQQARAAGRHAEAVSHFERALSLAPESTMILSELARAELDAGRLEQAEAHVRQALAIEGSEAGWHALLGEVLEARGALTEAADAFIRADSLMPNDEWRARARDLRDRAEVAALPESFRNITSAATITRADVAAYVGIYLRDLVEQAPARAATVATDIRTHWAAPWSLAVTRAGIMTVFPNHTFQPSAVVRRGDLAAVAAELARLAAAGRPTLVQEWEAQRPTFADVTPGNLFYEAAALATAAGLMTPDAGARFEPTRPATGRELQQIVERIGTIR
jgi:tetratricopeptide (TPR) repeat protein